MDPTGIPGLTIAVFDQLLKLGERTHQFISDARALDEVWKLYSSHGHFWRRWMQVQASIQGLLTFP
jgi:hypothetical protein